MAFSPQGGQIYDAAGRRKYLTAEELARFLAAANRFALPMRALCYVLAFTGCRLSEALALTTDQIDTEHGKLVFRTLKRRRLVFRAVPIPQTVLDMLRDLPTAPQTRLWPIHRATAWRHIHDILAQAGISGVMASPKGVRHGFGMIAADRNIPPNLIQRWMGHASLETTAIYLDAVGAEERAFAQRMW